MKQVILSVVLFLSFTNLFAKDNSKEIHVGLLNGPTCIPAASIMDNQKDRTFTVFADPQALLPKMIKKEIDIGFMPVNVAAKVYNSGNKALICCAVTGLGNISIITTDKKLRNFRGLKDKTVYTAGQGATPEYMLRYLLSKNKLTAGQSGNEDVTLDFSIPTAQIAAQLISGKIKYAAVPEPFATIAKMKSSDVITALDFQKEYLDVTGSQKIYPISVLVVRKEYAENNPKALEAFLAEYEKAVDWTIENSHSAALLTEKHKLGLDAAVVEKAIPVSNYTFISGPDAEKEIEELLKIFIDCDPKSIGGKLPEKEFYYLP